MTPLHITLPWPPRALSPNVRVHYMALARAKKRYRQACHLQAIAGHCRQMAPDTRLHLRLTFVPPDKRRRDLDNLIASMKAGLDGVADALGVDDSRWRLTFALDESRVAGMVQVQIERTAE